MKHSTTAAFRNCRENLPESIRQLADRNFALFKQNPAHPSLHFKKVGGELWSARIGIHYRALALEQDGDFTWFWCGSYAEYNRLGK